MRRLRSKLSYANVMATMAMFIALGGGAYAVTLHKNSVNSSAIKNGQVKTKDLGKNAVVSSKIKNGQVSSADVKDGSIGGADIQDEGVGGADLTPAEGFHIVGQPGEPSFGDGGQGDCLWSNFSSPAFTTGSLNPVSFYKDPYGVVHLAGEAQPHDGSGGDAACGGDFDDGFIFVLPPAYRPPHLELLPSPTTSGSVAFIVGAATDKTLGSTVIPAGTVIGSDSTSLGAGVPMDGATFRAVGPGNNLSRDVSGSPPGRSGGDAASGALPRGVAQLLK